MAEDADEELWAAGADVVINLKDYEKYGNDAGALKALSRRAPGHTPDRYRAVLGSLCAVHDLAVSAIGRHRVPRPDQRGRIASLEDIDTKACLAELDAVEPGVALRQKETILLRVIHWHYLR
jgi:hypothetical protein